MRPKEQIAADAPTQVLTVMGTEWRHGFLDVLKGSTTERVLLETRCPLLAVPVREALAY